MLDHLILNRSCLILSFDICFRNFRLTTNILEDCYELLYLVSTACEAGVKTLINSGGLRVIAPQMSDLPDGN